jgi:hypothetical protein
LKRKRADGPRAAKIKEKNAKTDRKIPDMYKRDNSPEQNGEDF